MNNMLVQQYQSRVLGPTEVVDYSSIVMNSYPADAFHQEPFIGFKVLCTDTNAYSGPPAERLRYIDANLGFLRGTGCIMRETSSAKPDGFWVMTLPCPRSQLTIALNNMMNVLATLEQYFGIIREGIIEICVSGKCSVYETESRLGCLSITPRYLTRLVPPENTPYRLGHVRRINKQFMMLRTRWDMNKSDSPMSIYEDLTVLSQLLASMYY